MIGRSGVIAKQQGEHAWVTFTHEGNEYLMETTANKWAQMTFPLHEIRKKYCPAFSVDTNFQTYRFGGAVEVTRLRLNQKTATAAATEFHNTSR